MVLAFDALDDGILTPARATNSGLESKKPTQSRFFYIRIRTRLNYDDDPVKVYKSSLRYIPKCPLRQLKKSLILAMLATG
ncbi:hypothetical protein ACLXAZ_15935, partial [Escherichia coli]